MAVSANVICASLNLKMPIGQTRPQHGNWSQTNIDTWICTTRLHGSLEIASCPGVEHHLNLPQHCRHRSTCEMSSPQSEGLVMVTCGIVTVTLPCWSTVFGTSSHCVFPGFRLRSSSRHMKHIMSCAVSVSMVPGVRRSAATCNIPSENCNVELLVFWRCEG